MHPLRFLLCLAVLVAAQAQAQNRTDEDEFTAVIIRQFDALRAEIAQLRSTIKRQEDVISRLQRQVNQNYIELDRRLRVGPDGQLQAGTGQPPTISGDFRTRLQAALSLMESAQLGAAQSVLSEILLEEPEHPDAPLVWYWLGEVYLQLRQYEDAEQAFSYLVAAFEKHWRVPGAAFKLGEIFRQQGDRQRARIQYSRVVERYPDSPSARLAALALESSGKGG